VCAEIKRSPYKRLLENPDFKRWLGNVERGSVSYAYECLRRMGYVQKHFGKSPSDLAGMTTKQATNFLLDIVSALEVGKRSGSYISNCVKPVKSWLDFNGIQIQQRIKISGRDELVRVADERPPTPDELRQEHLAIQRTKENDPRNFQNSERECKRGRSSQGFVVDLE